MLQKSITDRRQKAGRPVMSQGTDASESTLALAELHPYSSRLMICQIVALTRARIFTKILTYTLAK